MRRFFCISLMMFGLILWSKSACAATFADYVYNRAKAGDASSISYYVSRGYNINAKNPDGMTALCRAVAEKNLRAYKLLKELGASENVKCMSQTDSSAKPQKEAAHSDSKKVVTTREVRPVVKSNDNDKLLYGAVGLLAAGGVAAIALSGGSGGGSHHSSKPKDDDASCTGGQIWDGFRCVCPAGQKLDGSICVKAECPAGQTWNGEQCVCPSGQELKDGECVPIECPEGTYLKGDACVSLPECPAGERMVDGECVKINCPENTHLVGNICVSDDVNVEQNSDRDLYGISSDAESIFNLYSSPSYPDDEATLVLKNKGDGDVRGLYGYSGEAFNSYVIGETEGGAYINKKPVGRATIRITDEGKGTVYGMYSHISDITQYKEAMNAAGFNNGTAYGLIDIIHTGGGTTYGLAGDVRAYNAYTVYGGKAYGNIDIKADGDIYGIYGYVAAANAVTPFYGGEVKGNININSIGDGNVYGMMINKADIPGAGAGDQNLASWFAFNAYAAGSNVEGKIDITNSGDGNVYGMYGGQQLYNAMSYGGTDEAGNPTAHAKGIIKITNKGNGKVYGMYMPEEDASGIIANANNNGSESIIEINNSGSGVVTGMRGGKKTSITNSGDIIIRNDGVSVGIYGENNSKINNSGRIDIRGYRSSSSTGIAYGIYAENGASVVNKGEINVQAQNGAGIYLEDGATLENSGTVKFSGTGDSIVEHGALLDIYGEKAHSSAVDLNSLGGGEVILGQNGKFVAESLSGDMAVSEKITQGSFENYYVVKDALQANNTENLNLKSKSVLFEAGKKEGENGDDVVLTRRSFDTLMKNKNAAQFWEANYEQGNGKEIFDHLKAASTGEEFETAEINFRGEDVLPGFRRENALVYSHLSRQFNENLFNQPNEKFMGGYKYIDISRDKDGSLVGNDGQASTAYGMIKGQNSRGMTYGLGATISQIKSDYDNGASRKSNIFGLWLPVGYDFNGGTKWYSKLYAGYEDGSYDRKTPQGKYSSDITSYQYGLTNELRHHINLGHGFRFTPAAELNLSGIYQDGYDEGTKLGAVHTDKENILSLEGGLGAYLSKEFMFNEKHQLGIQIGGIYYVEFLDPDDGMDATLSGMDKRYKIKHQFDDDRAVLSARLDYRYKNLTLYGMIEQELKNYKGVSFDLGLQYNL